MNQNDALNDENINGNVPTAAEIGRQVKRVKTALALSSIPDLPRVTDEVLGQRAAKFTEMSLMNITNNTNVNQAGLVAAVLVGIQQACLPNGPIAHAIQQACLPNGPIAHAIQQACLPNGPIADAIQQACLPNGPIADAIQQACLPNGPIASTINNSIDNLDLRMEARYFNSVIRSRNVELMPVSNKQGHIPDQFPLTLGDFWDLNTPNLNQLLQHYALNIQGNANEKKSRLARYCHIHFPID
jgi:hypothetical protein